MTATDADPFRWQFVILGKWYRTQDKMARKQAQWTVGGYPNTNSNGNGNESTKDVGGGGGGGSGGGANVNYQNYFYPYKPAHVSHQTAEHKRLYAVPDAGVLFSDGRQFPASFRLRAPRPKIKTARGADGAASATTVTTYRCKFIPLARLHENSRLYGPILSSLPVVLSRLVSYGDIIRWYNFAEYA